MQPVRSSNIAAVGYDPGTRALTVQFHTGAQHVYEGVSPENHAGMMAADSVGGYFHAHIKAAHKSSKVEE